MAAETTATRGKLAPGGRFYVAIGFGLTLITYFAALVTDLPARLFGGLGTAVLNGAVWMLASLVTALVCLRAARKLGGQRRRVWQLVALGCLLWFAGQCVWSYYELVVGTIPKFPHWMQLLFIQYPMLLIVGMFALFLGMREAWIHYEEDRLITELNNSHDRLLAANAELSRTEQQVRSFNTALEQRVTERTQELQSAYRELESFSYAVAHDIKAPLRAINAFGALLIEEHGKDLNRHALGYVERMRRGALHMAQLVDDLLAYARIERLALQAQPTDVAALIETCIAEQRDEMAKLNARVTAVTTPLMVFVDSAALAQTLRNLIQNALEFSRHATPPQIAISTQVLEERIQIVVTDNGIGFDMQYHERIFALFQRLHRPDEYAGTGIGLAIARKAVERMGGRLWAQSKPNEGASFYIELPLKSGWFNPGHMSGRRFAADDSAGARR